MEKFILQCYDEYKKFMCLAENALPALDPIEIENGDNDDGYNPMSYILLDQLLNESVDLYYTHNFTSYSKRFQKAKLFHEFTHILDGREICKKYNEKDTLSIMSTYSEYHASQIELACNIGFRNKRSLCKINLDKTFIDSCGKTIKVENEYLDPLASALVVIDTNKDAYYNLTNYDYYSKYNKFEVNTMYYLGKKNLCTRLSMFKIPDITETSYRDFYPCVQKIENCIIDKDFESLILARKGLFWKFFTTFSFANLGKLLGEVSFL